VCRRPIASPRTSRDIHGQRDPRLFTQQPVAAIGSPGLRFRALRHTRNTIAARTAASIRELMARMGDDSAQAAIYQHAAAEADRAKRPAMNAAIRQP
jgi:integrase